MAQIYVWQPLGIGTEDARARFADRLRKQASFYEEHLSVHCGYRCTQVGSVLIGQIRGGLGIDGWQPWSEHADFGVAWGGISEDHLGWSPDAPALQRFVRSVIEEPHLLADLTGSFSVCAWEGSARRVGLVTGATQHQTLWRTEGPLGRAIGSRARPLLDLVGRTPELDEESANVFVGYKYLLGRNALFKGVARVEGRRHIIVPQDGAIRETVYQGLPDFLGDPPVTEFDEAVELCAERLKERVRRQVRFSRRPVLHLTGGRDSRCIAAALSHTSFSGPASTEGTTGSVEVRVAEKVADALGYDHQASGHDTGHSSLLELLARARDRAWSWTCISEGIEEIRHGLYNRDFFLGDAPFPAAVTQGFNGHHAGLQKPNVASFVPARLSRDVGGHLKHRDAVLERFEAVAQEITDGLQALEAAPTRWPDLFHWQIDALQWGQDNLLVKDLFHWWWTPLFDKDLIRVGWHLPETYQRSMRFVEAITLRLRPELARVPYEETFASAPTGPVRKVVRRMGRRSRALVEAARRTLPLRGPRRESLWEAALFPTDHPEWRHWLDESYVRETIRSGRSERLLWCVATAQLAVEAPVMDPGFLQ